MRELAPVAWKEKYGDDLKILITFVAGGNNGAVYLADNWEVIGKTAGLPQHKSSSMKWDNSEQLKEKFVKPTGENQKIILYKDIRTKREKKYSLVTVAELSTDHAEGAEVLVS